MPIGYISDQTTCLSNLSLTGRLSVQSSQGAAISTLSASNISVSNLTVTGNVSTAGTISASTLSTGGFAVLPTFSTASLIAAFVVQPSASSFTVVTWAAVAPGDAIQVFPLPGGAVSSLSSGLVAHSHCTQAGQVEMRLSNVSTLAQNQSTRTWVFVAMRSGFTT